MYSLADNNCKELAGSVPLDQIAQDLRSRGLTAQGVVVVDRTQTASRLCLNGSLYTTWSDLAALRDTYGWTFDSDGMTHNDITKMTASQQYEESCGSLAYLTENGHTKADGLFAYGDNNFTTSIQTNVVSTCFDYGRKYGQGPNLRSSTTSPWFQKTNSLLGGACNDPTQSCYNVQAGGRRYASPLAISSLLQVGSDQWVVVQFYHMVSGVSLNTSTAWDCTSSNWQEHWTNEPETYCINDFDQAISTIPAGAVVTDPATVATAWGRAVSNIAGRVTTDSNQPVVAATVSWSGGSTTTDTSGYYTLSSVAVGMQSVTVNATGYPQAAATVNVSSGNTTLQDFSLGSASNGAISGAVSDSQTPAQPVSAATVSYTGTGGTTGSGSTTTSTSGGYTFNGVPPGTYSVTASHTGFTTPAAQPVTVTAGTSATANFTMTATSGISGTVTDQTSAPVNGATVSYTGTGGTTGGGSTTTNSSGAYTLNGVPPGTYLVSASATGYTSPSAQTVTVTTGTTTSGVNFTLTLSSHQPIFSDGFESGTFSAWTKTSGLTVETTIVHAGTHAAEGRLNNSPMYAQKVLPSTYASGYERVWFNIVSQTSQINVLRARTAAGANLAFVMVLQTSHVLALNVLGNKVATSTTAVVPGSGWHELEMYAATNGATPSVQVWLDGIQVTSLTWNGSVGTTPIGEIQIGEASAQTWDVAFDDVAFDTQFVP
jgi:Carboxypeptidase regulatory-like domain